MAKNKSKTAKTKAKPSAPKKNSKLIIVLDRPKAVFKKRSPIKLSDIPGMGYSKPRKEGGSK